MRKKLFSLLLVLTMLGGLLPQNVIQAKAAGMHSVNVELTGTGTGSANSSVKTAEAGTVVGIDASWPDGNTLADVVYNWNGGKITPTQSEIGPGTGTSGMYLGSFVMPDGDVTVTVTINKAESEPAALEKIYEDNSVDNSNTVVIQRVVAPNGTKDVYTSDPIPSKYDNAYNDSVNALVEEIKGKTDETVAGYSEFGYVLDSVSVTDECFKDPYDNRTEQIFTHDTDPDIEEGKELHVISGTCGYPHVVLITVTLKQGEQAQMCSVTFAPGNGGTGTMDAVQVEKGTAYKAPETEFTKPEREFFGWMADDGTVLSVGEEIKVDNDTTLTALWKSINPPNKYSFYHYGKTVKINGYVQLLNLATYQTETINVDLNGYSEWNSDYENPLLNMPDGLSSSIKAQLEAAAEQVFNERGITSSEEETYVFSPETYEASAVSGITFVESPGFDDNGDYYEGYSEGSGHDDRSWTIGANLSYSYNPGPIYVCLGSSAGGTVKYNNNEPVENLAMNTSHEYPYSAITLKAEAKEGYHFAGWYEGIIGESYFVESYDKNSMITDSPIWAFFPMENTNIYALFVPDNLPKYKITIHMTTIDGDDLVPPVVVDGIPDGTEFAEAINEYSGHNFYDSFFKLDGYKGFEGVYGKKPMSAHTNNQSFLEDAYFGSEEIKSDIDVYCFYRKLITEVDLSVESPKCGTVVELTDSDDAEVYAKSQTNKPVVSLNSEIYKLGTEPDDLLLGKLPATFWMNSADGGVDGLFSGKIEGGKKYYGTAIVSCKYGYAFDAGLNVNVSENAEIVKKDTSLGSLLAVFGVKAEHIAKDEADIEVIKTADCENAGSHYEIIRCTHCDAELEKEEVTDKALDHDWSEWYVLEKPTAEKDGIEERVCKRNPEHKEQRPVTIRRDIKMIIHWSSVDGEDLADPIVIENIAEGTSIIDAIHNAGYEKFGKLFEKDGYNSAYILAVNPYKTYLSLNEIPLGEHLNIKTPITDDMEVYYCMNKVITDVSFKVDSPVCGDDVKIVKRSIEGLFDWEEQVGKPVIEIPADAHYRLDTYADEDADEDVVYWYADKKENKLFEGKFKGGESYLAHVVFTPNLGYDFSEKELNYSVENGELVDAYAGQNASFIWFDVNVMAIHEYGHAVVENDTKPTCTSNGYYDKVIRCKNCGDEGSRERVIVLSSGHDWGEWRTVKEATVSEEGIEERVCRNEAAHKETRPIAKLEAISYRDISGDGSVYIIGSGKEIEFVFKRSINDDETFLRFSGIEIDGKEISGEMYNAEPGSVRISLTAALLDSLKEGEHVIKAKFNDGEAAASFIVKAPAKEEDKAGDSSDDKSPVDDKADKTKKEEDKKSSDEKASEEEPSDEKEKDEQKSDNARKDEGKKEASKDKDSKNSGSNVPKTGDDSNIGFWLGIIVACIVVVFILLFFRKEDGKTATKE